MSLLALFRWEDDPEALLSAYDRELKHDVARLQPKRNLHVCGRREGGIVVVDVWETEADFRKMMDDPEFQKNEDAAGWPSDPTVETYEVHAVIE